MFASAKSFAALFLAVFAVGQVAASPVPSVGVQARSIERNPIEVLGMSTVQRREASESDAIVPFSSSDEASTFEIKKRSLDRHVAARIAKRDVNDISRSEEGAVAPNKKRDSSAINTTSLINGSKSDGGAIVPYSNTQKRNLGPRRVNHMPTHFATRSDGGDIVPF